MAMVNVVTIAAYRWIYWLRLIGLVQKVGGHQHCVLHSSDEPGELSQWQCTATITAPHHKHCCDYYYYCRGMSRSENVRENFIDSFMFAATLVHRRCFCRCFGMVGIQFAVRAVTQRADRLISVKLCG